MKQINNLTPTVHLSTYDDSETLYPVNKEHKGIENVCVAVKFGDILIKISSKNLCECDFNEALEKHSEELMSTIFWQIIGMVRDEVKDALKVLNHQQLGWILTNTEYSSDFAWYYNGYSRYLNANSEISSFSVRPAQAFQKSL